MVIFIVIKRLVILIKRESFNVYGYCMYIEIKLLKDRVKGGKNSANFF